MNRKERMKMLQSIAEHEERQQSKAFGTAQRTLADSEARLEELNVYRREYEGSIAARSGSSAIHWQEHHRFLQRLDEAIASQAAIVRDGRARREAHRRQWTLKRQRLESLTRVVERLETAETRDAERLEQRESDARSSRLPPFGTDS